MIPAEKSIFKFLIHQYLTYTELRSLLLNDLKILTKDYVFDDS